MKYLGLNFVCGMSAIGLFDSETQTFVERRFIPPSEEFQLYKRNPDWSNHRITKALYKERTEKLLKDIERYKVDYVVLTDFFASKPSLELVPFFKKKFNGLPVLHSDHKWGHINAVKFHPQFEFPALVADCSAQHSIIAYIPSPESIEVLYEDQRKVGGTFHGLGKTIIYGWAEGAGEPHHWSYQTYAERAQRGKVVFDFSMEVELSTDPFGEDILTQHLPQKMASVMPTYKNLETYRDDWVATQHEALRAIFRKMRQTYQGSHRPKTFFVGGGISRNTAFKTLDQWLIVPEVVGADDGSGCFMAYLGYQVNEHGLKLQHDRWKGHITLF